MKKFGMGLVSLLAVSIMASGVAMAQPATAPAAAPAAPAATSTAPADDPALLASLITEGGVVYGDYCSACHGVEGEGGGGPQLRGNGFVKGRAGVINQILFGATDHGMPPFADVLTDQQIAAVATYVRNSFTNKAGIVLPRSVELRRTQP